MKHLSEQLDAKMRERGEPEAENEALRRRLVEEERERNRVGDRLRESEGAR